MDLLDGKIDLPTYRRGAAAVGAPTQPDGAERPVRPAFGGEGVPFVVIGSCMKAGDVINLTARRVEVATGKILETATVRASADPERVFEDLPKVAQRLREAMAGAR